MEGKVVMRKIGKALAGLAVVLATIGSTCDDSDEQITGTYTLSIFESQDTCDQELNSFGSEATITANPEGGYDIEFGEEGMLSGDFSDEGVLVASGVIDDQGGGKTTVMQIGIVIRQGVITQGTGRITFNGTFPGNTGSCLQEFTINGDRTDNRVPVVG